MYLERQPIPLAGLDTRKCRFPCTRHTAKAIVFLWIERVDTDAHTHYTDLDQVLRKPVIDQHAIGSEHHHEAELHGIAGDVENIGTDERFTARDHEETAPVDLGDLIDEPVTFFGRKFIVSTG